ERVLRVRRPAGEDDPVDAHRRERQNIEKPRVDVREHHAVRERNDGPRSERRTNREQRCDEEEIAVRARRNDDLLEQQLEDVGEGLEQAERTHAIRADAHLDPANHLALGQREIRHTDDQWDRDRDDLRHRPYERPPGRPHRLLDRVHYALSSSIRPNIGPSERVEGCPAATRTQPSGTAASAASVSSACASPWRTRIAAPSARPSLESVEGWARARGGD